MTTTTTLLTAEQFRLLPPGEWPRELVRGKVVESSVPSPRNGYICANIAGVLREHVRARKLGRVMTNDSGAVTERDPDTVRGGDVLYFSFARLPAGTLPDGYLDVVPDIIFEVRSPTDRWAKINGKVGEYLAAGVTVVCVLDPPTETLTVFRDDDLPRCLDREDELTFPDILPDLRVRISEFID